MKKWNTVDTGYVLRLGEFQLTCILTWASKVYLTRIVGSKYSRACELV